MIFTIKIGRGDFTEPLVGGTSAGPRQTCAGKFSGSEVAAERELYPILKLMFLDA